MAVAGPEHQGVAASGVVEDLPASEDPHMSGGSGQAACLATQQALPHFNGAEGRALMQMAADGGGQVLGGQALLHFGQ
jgi:hypothetical protein